VDGIEGVVAVKLRSSYRPLILEPADDDVRVDVLAFAQVAIRHQARVLANRAGNPDRWDEHTRCSTR
jgi:hypothetical protein